MHLKMGDSTAMLCNKMLYSFVLQLNANPSQHDFTSYI